jgi:hypothetical protein
MNKSKGLAGGDYRKVMITLTPQQEAFLDTIRNEIKARKGHSLSRTEIIRALVDYLATLDLSLEGVRDEEMLRERIIAAATK